jgi:hypothetical protein
MNTITLPPAQTPDKAVREIVTGQSGPSARAVILHYVMQFDTNLASAGKEVLTMIDDDRVYRVSIFPDGVDVVCFGLSSIDSKLEGHYDRVDDLPNWVKERLAVLNMMSPKPPTNIVEGIGRRISTNVYWVYNSDIANS